MILLKKYNSLHAGSNGWQVWLMLLFLIFAIIQSLLMQKNDTIRKLITEYLRANGFTDEMIPIIVSQFAHETNNFRSKSFVEGYNPSGMKLPVKRLTTATGVLYGHAKYDDLEAGVKDFRLYYTNLGYPDYYNAPMQVEQYVDALKNKGYFEDSTENYTKGVSKFYALYYG